MGFFSKLFEKKVCSICGGEIGLLGNRKLEDGNCCKECAGKLSPWFDDRRHSSVQQIREQLAYREANRQKLSQFRPSKCYGEMYELKVELENGIPTRFVVAQTDDHLEENADLIRFDQVTSFHIHIEEDSSELMQENSEGEEVSYDPPRYEYYYDFQVEIQTDSPYCDEIHFRLNRSTLNLETAMAPSPGGHFRGSSFKPELYPQYREYKAICDEVESIFRYGMQGVPMPQPAASATATAPASEPVALTADPWTCFCGSVNQGKFCQNCGIQRFALDEIECSECSWTIEEETVPPTFCPNCGRQFNQDDIV